MTTDNGPLLAIVIPQIDREESCRLVAYQDTKGIWTIGWGRAGAGVYRGMTCTQAQANGWRDDHLLGVVQGLDAGLPWWRRLTLARQAVLVEMAYQLGIAGLLGFHRTLSAIEDQDWQAASAGMLASKWGRSDSPARAAREARQMLTGAVGN